MKSINFLQQEVITFCHTVLCRLYNKSHLLAFLIMLFHSNAKNYYVSSTFKITFGKTFFLTLQHFSVHSFLYHELWFANISVALRYLVSYAQFKKREKQRWRNVTFSKVANWAFNVTKSSTPPQILFTFFKIVQMLPNRAKRHM